METKCIYNIELNNYIAHPNNNVNLILKNIEDTISFIDFTNATFSPIKNSGNGVFLLEGEDVKSIVSDSYITINDSGDDLTFEVNQVELKSKLLEFLLERSDNFCYGLDCMDNCETCDITIDGIIVDFYTYGSEITQLNLQPSFFSNSDNLEFSWSFDSNIFDSETQNEEVISLLVKDEMLENQIDSYINITITDLSKNNCQATYNCSLQLVRDGGNPFEINPYVCDEQEITPDEPPVGSDLNFTVEEGDDLTIDYSNPNDTTVEVVTQPNIGTLNENTYESVYNSDRSDKIAFFKYKLINDIGLESEDYLVVINIQNTTPSTNDFSIDTNSNENEEFFEFSNQFVTNSNVAISPIDEVNIKTLPPTGVLIYNEVEQSIPFSFPIENSDLLEYQNDEETNTSETFTFSVTNEKGQESNTSIATVNIGEPTFICSKGYTYNPSSGLCERVNETPICPVGYTYNPTDVTCEKTTIVGAEQAHITFLIDQSGSIDSTEQSQLKSFVIDIVNAVFNNGTPLISAYTFSNNTNNIISNSSNQTNIINQINSLPADPTGVTNMADGLCEVYNNHLSGLTTDNKYLIIIGDGVITDINNPPCNFPPLSDDIFSIGFKIKSEGVKIIGIDVGGNQNLLNEAFGGDLSQQGTYGNYPLTSFGDGDNANGYAGYDTSFNTATDVTEEIIQEITTVDVIPINCDPSCTVNAVAETCECTVTEPPIIT